MGARIKINTVKKSFDCPVARERPDVDTQLELTCLLTEPPRASRTIYTQVVRRSASTTWAQNIAAGAGVGEASLQWWIYSIIAALL